MIKTLPDNSKERVQFPIVSGCLSYFPAAIAGVARHSYIGGAKYNDGGLVHLRYIGNYHMDAIGRHVLDLQDLLAAQKRGVKEVDTLVYDFEAKEEKNVQLPIGEAILIECNALAWRSLAFSQLQHERFQDKPLAPAAREYEQPPFQHPPVTINGFAFDKANTVWMVKKLRELTGTSLKEAIRIIKSGSIEVLQPLPHFTKEEVDMQLKAMGANCW